MDKLYLVTRADLPAAQRAVQAAHALRAFVDEHPDVDRRWFQESNHLAILEVPSERDLVELARQATGAALPVAGFWEPDRGGELTAVALGPAAKRLCRRLPLALQSV